MMQRYIVFLNDKTVSIHQDINIGSGDRDEIRVEYTDKESLELAYLNFKMNDSAQKLLIKPDNNFQKACADFNDMFVRIEAAGGIVRNRNNEFLFIKRLGIWDLPKGKLHKKEGIKRGAIREVMEETGLTSLEITRQLSSTFHIYTDRHGREILKETFWFEMISAKDEKLIPQTEEDITEVRWFSADSVQIPIQNTYASLKNLLENYLSEC